MEQLTRAESNVFELLTRGYNIKEIAEELKIKINTVKTLEVRIYKKTGIKGRMELLTRIIKNYVHKKIELTKLKM